MVTVRVEYDLDINEIIDRITHVVLSYGEGLPTSRTGALKIARQHCRENGLTKERWGEEHDQDDWAMYRADVAERMRLLFPRLSDEISG
ncbi:hypothetical protein [Nocardia sp. NPDC057030]